MSERYRVERVKLESGERLPLLLNADTGIPLFKATLFIITQLRATNRASATLQQAARSVMVAHQIFDYLGVNVEQRIKEGRLLNIGEIDSFIDMSGLTQDALNRLPVIAAKPPGRERVVSLEKVRMRSTKTGLPTQVAAQTKAIRLMYARDYLNWLTRYQLLRLDPREQVFKTLSEAARIVINQITERIPDAKSVNDLDARQGLTHKVRDRILEVIDPDSLENPWRNRHVRIRNQLIFRWLLDLGIRKGEFLGIRLDDINLRSGEVIIARRADDPADPRKDEPNTKGKSRLLSVGDELADLTMAYVQGSRKAIKGARKNPFLVVATGTGKPLSKAAISKLFVELRRKVTGLPEELSPHVLRHTWNDRFSEFMDENGVAPEEEEKLRKQQMGWSDHSKMAGIYTRRHIRKKTNQVSLDMQAAALAKVKFKYNDKE